MNVYPSVSVLASTVYEQVACPFVLLFPIHSIQKHYRGTSLPLDLNRIHPQSTQTRPHPVQTIIMKIILTGSTGFIGSAVLSRCLAHPSVTSIIALSRRPIPVSHPKLTTVIQSNFLAYPPEILSQLQGAEACIWVLGTPTSGKEVHVDYTLAAATAFVEHIAPIVREKEGRRFTFVYLSGKICERDQSKALWFLADARRMRGAVETELVEMEAKHADVWRTVVARPGGLSKAESTILRWLAPDWTIGVAELAAALADVVVSGESEHFMENGNLRERGESALRKLP
ncbi:hypothetical protein LTS09_017381 [Friedmanniomyces endolithicus]|nr:hypothetical protein LTS09_017381 [Friedmanniomyces endolithicus]